MTSTQAPDSKLTYSVVEKRSQRILLLTDGESTLKQHIGKKMIEAWDSGDPKVDRFAEIYFAAFRASSKPSNLDNWGDLRLMPSDMFEAAEKLSTPIEKLLLLALNHGRARASVSELVRAAQVLYHSRPQAYWREEPYIRTTIVRPSSKRDSMTEWLDFMDFMVNAEPHETYGGFNAIHSGRVFTTEGKIVLKGFSEKYRTDDYSFSAGHFGTMAHRFIQLSRRSQKIKKKLHSMKLSHVSQALSMDFPGTLLVEDTILLLDNMKHVPRNSEGVSYYRHGRSLEEFMGTKLANQVKKVNRETIFIDHFQRRSQSFIEDPEYPYFSSSPFILFAVQKIGAEKTAETMEKLQKYNETVTLRGWCDLVRRGGFAPEELVPYVVPLLGVK